MTKRNIFLTTVLVLITFFLYSAATVERTLIRIENPTDELLKYIQNNNFDVAHQKTGKFIDVVVSESEIMTISEMEFDYTVIQTEDSLKSNLLSTSSYRDSYRTYLDMYNELVAIEQANPEIAKLYNIGDSRGMLYYEDGWENYSSYQHNIWAMKLTLDPDDEHDRPALYYMGGLHAREPLSVEVPMEFLNYLIENYEDDPEINYLVNNTEIWFVPLMNPNGHKVVIDQIDVWWRKNIRDNNNNQQFDTFNQWGQGPDGVDLNRNWDYYWQASTNINAATYPGPYPISEPESVAFDNLVQVSHFITGISYHTYGEMVLFPYGYAEDIYAPDYEVLSSLAFDMAMSIPKINSPGYYDPMPAWELYPARGTSEDYLYGVHGIIAFTFEMADQFIPPYSVAQQIAQDNLDACMILLNRVHNSILTGIITDSITGEVLEAEVIVEGVDGTGEFRHPITSKMPYGRYYRLLQPGEYNVTFEAFGYESITFTNIEIEEIGKTILDVEMYQLDSISISGAVYDFYTEEPLKNAVITLQGTSYEEIYTNQDGIFVIPAIYPGSYVLEVTAENYSYVIEQFEFTEDGYFFEFYLYPPYLIDNFEEGLDNWHTTGDWGLCTDYSYSGNFSLADSPGGNYSNFTNSIALLNEVFNLEESNVFNIEFYTKYFIETDYDFCYLEVFYNHVWHEIDVFTGNQPEWEKKVYVLNDINASVVRVRFRFTSDVSINDLGIYIDNFKIYTEKKDTSTEQPVEPEVIGLVSYPNPFNLNHNRNSGQNISLYLPYDSHVKLSVFNIKGQKVAEILNDFIEGGRHNLIWDGKNHKNQVVSSGLYFYKIETERESVINKIMILK